MRKLLIFALLFALPLESSEKNVPLDELIRRAGAASLKAQPGLFIEIAQRQLDAADKLYSSGDTDKAQTNIAAVVNYSEKAVSAAKQSGSHLKNVEIGLRKMAERLRAIRDTLAFGDQKPVQDAASRLEGLRTDILARMFSKNKGHPHERL